MQKFCSTKKILIQGLMLPRLEVVQLPLQSDFGRVWDG